MSLLNVQNLSISFPQQAFVAVNDISFSLNKGETLAIVGESGSGKSVTALALSGLLPNTAKCTGNVVLNNDGDYLQLAKLTDKNWLHIRGKHISMVFQEPMSALNPVMKIGQQLSESILVHQKMSTGAAYHSAIEWLDKVQLPEPDIIYDRYPHQLSGGQKQRVMIAMAMCHQPDILIADEPTTALDVLVQNEIIALMKQLQQDNGSAMIFITHDLNLAAAIADNIMVMYKGNIAEYNTAVTVFNNPAVEYTRQLIDCRPTPGKKGTALPTVNVEENSANIGIDTPLLQPVLTPTANAASQLLSVKDVKIWFPGKKNWLGKPMDFYKAVDGVTMNIATGETLGLVGASGCGKSTLSRAIMGLTQVTEGNISFNGAQLTAQGNNWKTARREMQMVFQDPYSSLNPRINIREIIAEPMRIHNTLPAREIDAEVKRLLSIVEMPATAMQKYPHQFSGGQRQRIGIARALALKPKLMICDESVSALDVSIQAQILNLLKNLQSAFDLTYLFISHDLDVVYYFCDRIIVMEKGKFVEQGSAAEVYFSPTQDYTKKLLAANKQFHG